MSSRAKTGHDESAGKRPKRKISEKQATQIIVWFLLHIKYNRFLFENPVGTGVDMK